MSKKVSKEEFINRADTRHNHKYDYHKVTYKKLNEKVCIICPVHGEFWQQANNHLQGQGCPKCRGRGNTQDIIIQRFIEVHGDKYDYSKVVFKRVDEKVCIVCPVHGEFWQTPRMHLNGNGCKYCAGKDMNTDEFIRRANIKHNGKYLYNKALFLGSHAKLCIICPVHGEFWQQANNHLSGNGCPKCARENVHMGRCFDKSVFLERSVEVHGDKYNYSMVNYYNIDTNVCIICPIHGTFFQTPYKHINCKHGCPKCNSSKLENEIRQLLLKHGIKHEEQKTFEWLKNKRPMFLDFYLPTFNVAIECQGGQHFAPVDFAGKGNEWAANNFTKTIERDEKKRSLCEKHKVKLLYYTDYDISESYTIHKNKEMLLNTILHDTAYTEQVKKERQY